LAWRLRCRKGDAEGNTIALPLMWLLGVALQGLSGPAPKTNNDSSRYSADDRYMVSIIARPWLLSMTESFALPPKTKGGHMPNSRFDLREWVVPPVLMPVFLVLLVAAAMVAQW
jgi:hypothetical protein